MIHLGYETGTGKPISIPLAHMAITGLTQQSGKTTTLEALIDRGELRAVVFVTKPGEKSFSEGRRILPFFKEHADWEYVKELLEARRSESLSKWDGYLMRVCSRAHTLKDVRANVQKELPKRKSVRPSHYEVLAGYLDLIIPELDRVEYTDKLEIQRGVNIMDLGNMSDEMQSMVIRSTIEQIHKREHNSVLVLPEAWKFIPEGGRSAVFQALQALIREGATNGNFVWLDAQDLAVVSKRILKSVSVWILGKQQEANEVARTINHLIEPLQIRPDMIKSLGVGQFLVCADSLPARKVYVQPRWLGELDALAIARGEESVETAQAIFRQKKRELAAQSPRMVAGLPKAGHYRLTMPPPMQSDAPRTVFPFGFEPPETGNQGGSEHGQVNTEKHGGTVEGIPRPAGTPDRNSESIGPDGDDSDQQEAASPARAGRILKGGQNDAKETPQSDGEPPTHAETSGRNQANSAVGDSSQRNDSGNRTRITEHESRDTESDAMWKERAEQAEAEVTRLREEIRKLNRIVLGELDDSELDRIVSPNGNARVPIPEKITAAIPSIDWIYAQVRERAQNDPGILDLLSRRPELRVTVEPQTLEVDGSTLRGGIALLIHKGFFSAPKNGNTTFNELQRLGRRTAKPNVYRELDKLAEMGFLTKEDGGGYQATDLRVTVRK